MASPRADADTNEHTDGDPICHSDSYADQDTYPHSHGDADGHIHPHTVAHTNRNGYVYTDGNGDGKSVPADCVQRSLRGGQGAKKQRSKGDAVSRSC